MCVWCNFPSDITQSHIPEERLCEVLCPCSTCLHWQAFLFSDAARGRRAYPAPDDVLENSDVRYWMLSSGEAHDLESALLSDPLHPLLWMKLAYKKLHATDGYALCVCGYGCGCTPVCVRACVQMCVCA